MLDRIALILTIIGALNWGSIGLFQFDLVAWLFGGQDNIVSRVIYALVGLGRLWCIPCCSVKEILLPTEKKSSKLINKANANIKY